MFNVDWNLLRSFYNKLADEESRFIFRKRVEYLISGEDRLLTQMTYETNSLFHLPKIIRDYTDRNKNPSTKTIIYGGGGAAQSCLNYVRQCGGEVIAICDKKYEKPGGEMRLGLPTLSPRQLAQAQYNDCDIVVSAYNFKEEICTELVVMGINENRIFLPGYNFRLTNYLYSTEYFSHPMHPEENEVYVDCGMFNGGSVKAFIQFCKGNYRKIYGFEPNPNSYKQVVEELKDIERIEVLQRAAWGEETTLHFDSLEDAQNYDPMGARIAENGKETIKSATIDNTIGDDRVTFIKMDIEGAELEALKGAKNTILRDNPKLAICLYHKPEDIIEIPLYIYSLQPNNQYYIRHHNFVFHGRRDFLDTVLYVTR